MCAGVLMEDKIKCFLFKDRKGLDYLTFPLGIALIQLSFMVVYTYGYRYPPIQYLILIFWSFLTSLIGFILFNLNEIFGKKQHKDCMVCKK